MAGMPPQFAKAAAVKKAGAKKAMPVKKAVAKKVAAKKAAPFAKKMSDAACPPGSMSGGVGTSSGLGAVKKAAKKAMGEVPNGKVATPRQQRAVTPGKRTNRVGVTAGKRTNRVTKGTASTTGSREN